MKLKAARILLPGVLMMFFHVFPLFTQDLETGFETVEVLCELQDPASFAFAPDGRLFYGERITGKLRVAAYDAATQTYNKLPAPFYEFDVPPQRHRSSGLRGFAFDPNFSTNGYIYVFYMRNNPRHNRVARIQADPSNPNVALPGETVLMDLPFNNTTSSGSHNGGALAFGADGKLYFTTGDGWNGGDNVQSLSTYTGKVMRINTDGSIPTDNPFYNQASGDFRAIYALGLRNPYSISNLSPTGKLYVNDAINSNKASVFKLAPGANFGHDGYNGIGTQTSIWANMSVGGASVIAGGLWYPPLAAYPSMYHGNYFAAFWGSNSAGAPGAITRAESEANTSKSMFYSNMILPGDLKPVLLVLGPDGNIHYLMTDYETGVGEIYAIDYTGTQLASTPMFDPPSSQYEDPVTVSIFSASNDATIYYTLDGTEPDDNAILYTGSFLVSETTTVLAIAYEDGLLPSLISSATYTIETIPNIPPIADAGPDFTAEVNTNITLNGSDTYDPDGISEELQESWQQLSGPAVVINDADETVSNFTPTQTGTYEFEITVEDIYGAMDKDTAVIEVVGFIEDYLDCLIGRWSFEEGSGSVAEDTSPNSNTGTVINAAWSGEGVDESNTSLLFDAAQDLVDIGQLDISGDEMTICFWTKLNSFETSDARFISKAYDQFDDQHYWMVSTLNESRLRFRLKTNNGGTTTLSTNPNVVGLNEWIFVTALYDGQKMKLFKNAVLQAEQNKTGTISSDPLVDAAIGNQPLSAAGGQRHLDGYIDELRIYGCALTDAQINQVYNPSVVKVSDKTPNWMATNIYPMPVNDIAKINIYTPAASTIHLQLHNSQGVPFLQKKRVLSKGDHLVELDLSALPAGVYLLLIEDDQKRQVWHKVVKQ